MNIEEKILTGESLSEEEVAEWIYGVEPIDRIADEPRRWYSEITLIYKLQNRYFKLCYDQALTEIQEDDFWSQIAQEVTPHKKIIETIEWCDV